MTRTATLTHVLVAALISFLGTAAMAEKAPATQPASQPAEGHGHEMSPRMQEMMQKWMELAAPAEPHAMLATKAGVWDYHATMWCPVEGADAQPMKATGKTKAKVILGGRFLLEHAMGDDPHQPFEGMGFTGYDKIADEFVAIWIDTMSTGVMVSRGHASADARTITYTAEYSDPISGAAKTAKSVETRHSDDHWTMQMFEVDATGEETKTFEITYNRAD